MTEELFNKYLPEMDNEVLADEGRIALYIRCREQGETPRGADMLACQRGPGLSGHDGALLKGELNGNQYANCPWVGNFYKKTAEKMAPGCTSGAKYMTQLARFPGDPNGWVKSQADVKRAAKARGLDLDGVVKCRYAREAAPKDPIPLSKDIVNQYLKREAQVNPAIKTDAKQRKRAIEDIYTKHTPYWKKKFLKG